MAAGVALSELLDNNPDMLTRVLVTIRHVATTKGHPQPPHAKPLRDANPNLCEIRTKYDRENLLRIYYFVDKENDNLILLNYIIKPDGRQNASHYEGKAGKKLKREIATSIEIAIELQTAYHHNHPHYEPLSL